MRMIDADNLIWEIENSIGTTEEEKEFCKTLVQMMPIAYDVEKVLEELEHEQYKDCYSIPCIGINEAIEIVKKGGVE